MVTASDRSRGVSAIGAILAILIFSLLMAVVVSVVTIGASIGLQEEQGIKAFYIAEGGLQYAIENGTPPCDFDVPAPVSLGGGSFTAGSWCVGPYAGCAVAATVADNPLGAADTWINMSAPVADYVVPGTIRIDDEYILCTDAVANQFTGCMRGWANSTAAPHAFGVSATQCVVNATGIYSSGVFFGDVKRTVQASVGQ
jgi:hypothetical protein